ncbi:Ribonuclease [Candidatus Zixiibacteriota bacterium]|nr:Ribonuclease [candidate division Zixibacteria bacterium]
MNIWSGPIRKETAENILGVDESGKGDFFGPLVIAGVLCNREEAEKLTAAGVRDSKKITDGKIVSLSAWIEANFHHTVVLIGPEKYNQLYAKIRNLNRLLAWGHSRVIENIASDHKVDLAISDKFGKTDFIEKALMEKGKQIVLHQEVRAEAIAQVAAASILARAGFIKQMEKYSSLYGMALPKGAGDIVDRAAVQFVRKYGAEALDKVAKVHFKNYQRAVG